MPAILHDAVKDVAKSRVLLRLLVPFRQYRYGHFDIAAQLFRRMAAQEQAIEKGRLALGKREVCGDFCCSGNKLCRCCHKRKGSLPKSVSASSSTEAQLARDGQLQSVHC